MQRFLPLLIAVLLWFKSTSINALDNNPMFVYTLDIANVVDDRVQVQLETEGLSQNDITFYIPKIIPGTYRVADYGRFVSDFKAFDKKNKPLKVERLDDNSWKISKAKKLARLSYWVDDTYDTELEENMIFPMAGTNIEAGKNIVINTPGYFGYFEGMHKNEFEVNIVRPNDFYGSTGLIKTRSFKPNNLNSNSDNLIIAGDDVMVDTYHISDYHRLIDSPIMYNVPDTTIIKVGNTEVLISAYAPKGMITSKFIAENVEQILMAQKEYLGGELPVEKYAFIYYFEDYSKALPVNGALEHSYSSYYYFPEVPEQYLAQILKDVAAHEFFHIVTPLNVHSEEIEYFDFNEPKMSSHLWMYEGITEYFSDNVQVKYNIISDEDYLNVLREKIINAADKYNDTLSFTDLSKYTLDQYKDEYNNVYEKGALIGMCLDIKLRQLSDGEYGVQELMRDLSVKYGKTTPFKDDELFGVISQLTYPEIDDFINRYIVQGGVLPYREVFDIVGIDYLEYVEGEEYSLGFTLEALTIDTVEQKIKIIDADKLDSFGQKIGFETGDILVRINGKDIPELNGMAQFFFEEKSILRELDELSYTVIRQNENEEKREVELKAPVQTIPFEDEHVLMFNENPSEDQLKVRESWLRVKK
ncbi:peptidase M61 [Reichenbachiella sp. MALMAid0571]|uniref:M61 family metallopeptidase n=1 Tax=Reichenbachiella sp. MALMAid0571 TaxID=3143939 RepID=UPI0032DEBEB4